MRTLSALVGLVAAATHVALAQGLPFHTETALTMAFEESGLRAFGALQSRGGVETFMAPVAIVPFAPHQRVTIKATVPWVHKRFEEAGAPSYSAGGIGDIGLGVKWAPVARDRHDGTTRFAVAASVGLPTGRTEATLANGLPAPRPWQPGSGALRVGVTLVGTVVRGPWAASADLGHTRTAHDDGYRPGPTTRYDLALGLRLPRRPATVRTRTVQFYLEWNGSVTARGREGETALEDSGGHIAYLSPGVQWVVLPQLLIETSVQIPVVQDHNGAQPDFGIRPALGARLQFF